ncbi:MAG: DMT family transporter [Alphaproteobacteria bacterium]
MSPNALDPRMRRRGIVLAILANLCFSSGGFWVRSMEAPPDGFEVVFWRSLSMTIVLAAVTVAWRRGETISRIRDVGAWGVVSAAFLASTFFAFILSVMNTTVANTAITMSLAPLMAALAGRAFLGERVAARTWAAIAVAGIGLAVMMLGSVSGEGLLGIVIALAVPAGLAANVVINRRHGGAIDMTPTVLIAGLLSMPLALALGWPIDASARDIGVILLMGAVQLAGGCLLITMAMRYLPAVEVGLFTLLETVLGPVWVWLAHGETPSPMALLGGALIVGALLANSLFARRRDGAP